MRVERRRIQGKAVDRIKVDSAEYAEVNDHPNAYFTAAIYFSKLQAASRGKLKSCSQIYFTRIEVKI